MITRFYFDTETTGFKGTTVPMHESKIVQFAGLLIGPDWEEIASVNVLRKPIGWEIPAQSTALHGISTAKALANGVNIMSILAMFNDLYSSSQQIVGHNVQFDINMMAFELGREGLAPDFKHKNFYCTMHGTTQLCKLPGFRGQFKWPKLSEAYEHFFKEELVGAHDALVDVRACARIHRHLLEQGLIRDLRLH